MGSNSLGSKANFTQSINFKGSEDEYSAEIVAQDVTINSSSGEHSRGSSKVKLVNLVNFSWELKYYIGELLAAHVGGKIFAYAIKVKNSSSMIRITNTETDQRILIKDLKGCVQDISFALTPAQVILGCVDEDGNLYVYSIDGLDTDKMYPTLLLHVIHPNNGGSPCSNYRVIWCPYIPPFGEDSDTLDDPAKLLVLLNRNKAEVWDVSVVNNKYGVGPLEPLDEYEGYVEIDGHDLDVIDASFSPDGTALATASLDGYVKFFQVYLMAETEEPRCLHHWQPHNGEALSCLLFLDNVNTYGITDSKFWKFAITGANQNAELKIWSCETWTCLQTIRFDSNPHMLLPKLYLKVSLDMAAEYLIMSDIHNRILYVLNIHKNEEERLANIASVSEFLLPNNVVSFCVQSAGVDKLSNASSSEDLYHAGDDLLSLSQGIVIKMYVVTPKTLQECTVAYRAGGGTIESNIKSVYGNATAIEDVHNKLDEQLAEIPKLNDLKSSVTLLIQQQQLNHATAATPQINLNSPIISQTLNLMTPDDFNSPILNASPNNILTLASTPLPPPSDALIEAITSDVVLIDFEQPQKDNCASGGSSPSREVQEIMALNKPTFNSSQEFDELFEKSELDLNKEAVVIIKEAPLLKSEWPNIPMLEIDALMKEAAICEPQPDAIWGKVQMLEIDDLMKEATICEPSPPLPASAAAMVWSKAQMQALNYRLSSLEALIRDQNLQIVDLKEHLGVLSAQKPKDLDLRAVFAKELDIALNKHQLHTTKLLEGVLKEQKRKEREQHEAMVTTISSTISKQVIDNLQAVMLREIQAHILPPIMQVFDKLKHQLDTQYSQKLNTIDQLLKANISKLFSNKAIADSLSLSIITVIKPSLENCYKDMISTTLIPSWEKVCTTMFQQIHNTFTQGTKEYTCSVESYMERQRKVQDKGKELINQIQAVSETMRSNADKLSGNISNEMQRQINIAFTNMQEKLSHMITELVKEQVRLGFKTHAAVLEDSVVNAVRSRAVTPAPHHLMDTQVQIQQLNSLIAKGSIDTAFQQALSASATASDLSLVLHVCNRVNPHDVFGAGACILQQHVLLSLVQQLGADLTHHTEVKHRYLQEAILNLEPGCVVTREHVPIVLKELMRQLNNFIMANATNKNITNMRMLLMATKALLK